MGCNALFGVVDMEMTVAAGPVAFVFQFVVQPEQFLGELNAGRTLQ